jgi:hypothetical protein
MTRSSRKRIKTPVPRLESFLIAFLAAKFKTKLPKHCWLR